MLRMLAFVFLLYGCLFVKGAQVEVEPREVLVLPRQNVTFMCHVGVPLQYCRVEIPGMIPLNLNTRLSNPDVSYTGAGLDAGQCGFTINNISDRNNGLIKCTLGIETETQESVGTMQLIVARAPKVPEMDLSRGTDSLRVYKINDLLQASCIVKDGRPVANISWYLDDEPLYGDGLSMPTVVDFAKENLQSKLQNLTRLLVATDNGKFLRCIAYHPAYPNGRAEAQRQLDVKYAPLPLRDLQRFGYILGQPGLINVVIEANPKPQIEWIIGGERIREGDNDQTGKIEAEAVRDLGKGRYEVNLRIAAINKEDTEKDYILTAYNDMGTQDYPIKISTSAEPEGLELGIGGIIGIILSLFIILLIVFLFIFAKLTGRWCFSDSGDTRNFGETSDTESADVKPRHSLLPTVNLRSLLDNLKKSPKTVDNEECGDQSELKKMDAGAICDNQPQPVEGAIVYAELDLVNSAAGNLKPVIVKNGDDKTEYAEIVYTPNNNNENGEK